MSMDTEDTTTENTPLGLVSPDDWKELVNVSEDSLVIAADSGGGLWAITADDPDGTGDLIYRTWFIPESVTSLPSQDVQEVRFSTEPTYRECIYAVADLMDLDADADE